MSKVETKCPKCLGIGRVNRTQKRLPDGTLDTRSILNNSTFTEETCDGCGGNGTIMKEAAKVPESASDKIHPGCGCGG
jgi:DnaJ-class molecular chaperone